MPFQFRLSLFFDEPKQGWSENYYYTRNDLTLKDQLDEFDQLTFLRAALLGEGASLTHIRCSAIKDLDTGEKVTRVFQGRDINRPATTTNKLCSPHDSLLVKCISADQRKRKDIFLGGVWMRLFDQLRHYQSVDDFQTRFMAWAAEVKARGLGWLTQAADNNVQITNYTFDPVTGRTTYVLSGPITFAPGTDSRRVTVNFPGGHEALDGVQLVSPIVGEPNSVITTKPRPTHPFDGRLGRMKSYTYSFIALGPTPSNGPNASIDPQRQARRNRGKSSYAEAGRRAAQTRY